MAAALPKRHPVSVTVHAQRITDLQRQASLLWEGLYYYCCCNVLRVVVLGPSAPYDETVHLIV